MPESEKTSDRGLRAPGKVASVAAGHEVDAGAVPKHADRDDGDEALRILAEGEVTTMTPEEEKKLLRKIDWHIMPLLCVVYGLNYLDKTAVSYASIMGLRVRQSCLCGAGRPSPKTE